MPSFSKLRNIQLLMYSILMKKRKKGNLMFLQKSPNCVEYSHDFLFTFLRSCVNFSSSFPESGNSIWGTFRAKRQVAPPSLAQQYNRPMDLRKMLSIDVSKEYQEI
jgi:hypothetical protein